MSARRGRLLRAAGLAALLASSLGAQACGLIGYRVLDGGSDAPDPSLDATGLDATGLDAASLDAPGLDATGLDAGGRGCVGPVDGNPFCAAGEVCNLDSNRCEPAPMTGSGPPGSDCVGGADCTSGLCVRERCREVCTDNGDCTGEPCTAHDPGGALYCDASSDCGMCSSASSYCDEALEACVQGCMTSADCAGTDCRIRSGGALLPSCGTTTDCAADELRIDLDEGAACVRWEPCVTSIECPPGRRCLELDYPGLGAPVALCGREL